MAAATEGVGRPALRRWGAWVQLAVVIAVAGVTQIALTIAFTSLVFRDGLVDGLPLGLAAMSLGLVVCGVVVAMRSGLGGHLAGPQDSGMVVISAMVPSIVASATAPADTILVLMGLGSVLVGLTLFVLGTLGLGRLIRYLPFPVMAGFLAGTGLVMGRSTLALLLDGITGEATGGRDAVIRTVIGVAVSVTLVVIARSRLPTERLVPLLVLGAIVAVQVGLSVAGIGRTAAAERGYLLPALPGGSLLRTEPWLAPFHADWTMVGEQAVGLLPLVVLAPLTILLYLGALESMLEVELDTDREFRLLGAVNIVNIVPGSAPSYTQFAATTLVQQMAGGRRIVPLAVALSGGLVVIAGDSVVALAPQPVVAGLLGFIALTFIIDWLWDTIARVSTVEWLLAAAIAASILFIGFLPGVGLGVALAAGWFVLQYSRVSGVRRMRDASLMHSNVERTQHDVLRLEATGRDVLIVEPEGFLFFGTGDTVARTVIDRVGDTDVRFVIIDLGVVTGADSSAAAALGQLVRWARRRGTTLIWCGMQPRARRALGPLVAAPSTVEAPDLDHALELTEVARLGEGDEAAPDREPVRVPGIDRYGRRVVYRAGEHLFERGEPGPGLVVIEDGWAEVVGAPGIRRRRVGPGSILGEVGLVQGGPATATVVAESSVEVTALDRASVERMVEQEPSEAAHLYEVLARSLADRLVRSDAELDGLRTQPPPERAAQ